jgi:hypothetical protein
MARKDYLPNDKDIDEEYYVRGILLKHTVCDRAVEPYAGLDPDALRLGRLSLTELGCVCACGIPAPEEIIVEARRLGAVVHNNSE